MRKGKLTALTVGAAALAVGAVAAVAPAGSAATTSAAQTAPTIAIQPGVIHPTSVMSTPSQANCVKYGYYHCLTPGQVEDAYNLPPLYRQGVTGKGETIVIVDSFGSPTIKHDLAVFDQQFKLPAPPSFRIITPSGLIPKWNQNDSDMTGWGGETTLDVEYAHTIAPGANILLVETPVSETEGVTGFPQIVKAENYVLKNHLGDVISQSFSATEQTFSGGLKQIDQDNLRSAYITAAREKDGPTVLAASGDSGVADVELNGIDLLHPPGDLLARQRPAGDRRRRHRAGGGQARHVHVGRVERHLQQATSATAPSRTPPAAACRCCSTARLTRTASRTWSAVRAACRTCR